MKLSKKMFYHINSNDSIDLNLKCQALMLIKYFMKYKINVRFLPDFSFDIVWSLYEEEKNKDLENFFSSFVYYNIKDKEPMRMNYTKIQCVLDEARKHCI